MCDIHLCPSHCAGEDAVKFEGLPDDVITAKAVAVLRSIFGDQNVPEVQFSIQFSIVEPPFTTVVL